MTPEIPAAEDSLLAQCPYCGYRLAGLPELHRCPECGHEVDRRWKVFGGPGMYDLAGRRRVRDPVRYLLLLPAIYAFVTLGGLSLMPGRAPLFVLVATSLVLTVVVARYILARPKSFLALGPAGLFVWLRRRSTVYAWPDVGRAQYDLLRKCIAFPYGGETERIPIDAIFRTAMSEVDRCVQAINRFPRENAERGVLRAEKQVGG